MVLSLKDRSEDQFKDQKEPQKKMQSLFMTPVFVHAGSSAITHQSLPPSSPHVIWTKPTHSARNSSVPFLCMPPLMGHIICHWGCLPVFPLYTVVSLLCMQCLVRIKYLVQKKKKKGGSQRERNGIWKYQLKI